MIAHALCEYQARLAALDLLLYDVCREIYNGKRWRTHQLYKAPMGEVGDLRVFLNDFLYFTHPAFGCSIGKVRHFFCKVHIYVVCYVVCTCHTHVNIFVLYCCLKG